MMASKLEKIGNNSKTKTHNNSDIGKFVKYDGKNDFEEQDRIANFFMGKTIFITGGTGYIGKVLFEKLLRSCSGLKKIYLLIKEKKGKTPQERLQEMLNNPLFDLLKEQRGEETILKQTEAVQGDVVLPNLGFSREDRRKITEEVEIIYHSAATIRFDESFRYAVFVNIRGTKFMLDLARECKMLKLFAHISTAYCHCIERILYEKPYKPQANPEKIIQICEKFDDDKIAGLEKKILGNYPNNYSYTKALSEDLVVKTFHELPTIMLRPSIVIPMLKDPVPGWTDNMNGPTGLFFGGGKGVLRTLYFDGDLPVDLVPVDVVVSRIILATWYNQCIDNIGIRVLNITNSNEVPTTWNEVINIAHLIGLNKIPFNMVAWYPNLSVTKSRFLHKIYVILFHWIPAHIGDSLLRLAGYPPVLLHVQNRITKATSLIEYFLNREWNFVNTEVWKALSFTNLREKDTYVLEMQGVDLIAYFENATLCARRFIFKTPDDMLPAARRHIKMMWFLDRFCKISFSLWLAYFVYKKLLLPFCLSKYEAAAWFNNYED